MKLRNIFCTALLIMMGEIVIAAKLTKKYVVKGDLKEVTKACENARNDSVQKRDPQTWYFSGLVQERIYNEKNADLYLQKKGKKDIKVDTVQFYSCVYDLFHYMLVCDSLESEQGTNKFRKQCVNIIKDLRPNLNSGGLFYLQKEDYKNAYPYFALLVDVYNSGLFKTNQAVQQDPLLIRAAYSACLAAYFSQNYEGVVKYSDIAMKDTTHTRYAMIYKCLSLKKLGNTDRYLAALGKGMDSFPADDFFYMELINYYGNYPEKIDAFYPTAEKQLQLHPDKAFYYYALGLLNIKKENYPEAIKWNRQAVERDSTNIVYLKDLGQCYFMLAQMYEDMAATNIESPRFKEDRQRILNTYRLALSCYERLKTLAPDDKSLWVSALYTIYFKLNMGKQFQEIEKLMR